MSSDGRGLKDEGTQTQVAIAGAVAGLVARFITAPLDVLKIRLQLSTHPLNPTIIRKTPPNDLSPEHQQGQNKSLSNQSKRRRPYAFHLLQTIIRTEGPTALWKGNVPAQLLYLSYSAVQFSTYRFCAGSLSRVADSTASTDGSSSSSLTQPSNPPSQATPTATPTTFQQALIPLVAGATAGAVATAITYPLDLLRTRFAAQGAAATEMMSPPFPPGNNGIVSGTKKEKVYPTLRAAVRSLLHGEEPPASHGGLSHTPAAAAATAKTIPSRFRAAYRGLAAAELGTAPYMGLFFCSYEALRPPLRALFSLRPSVVSSSLSSSASASASASAAPPPPSPSPSDATANTTTIGYASARTGTSTRTSTRSSTSNTAAADISASTVAALLSKTAVFPLDTVRKRMQVEGPLRHGFTSGTDGHAHARAHAHNAAGRESSRGRDGGTERYRSRHGRRGTFLTLSDIVQREGWRGLYRGWAVGLGKAAPASVVTVGVYEWVLARLMRVHDGD